MNAFCERFPQYALLAPRWEPCPLPSMDVRAWRAGLKIAHIEVLYLFGLDFTAYDLFSDWLHEYPARRLVFLEEQTGVIASLLEQNAPLFEDPQVDFALLPTGKAASHLMQQLAERYPAQRIDALLLPGRSFARWRARRLELLRKTTLTHALFCDRLQGDQLFSHFIRNVPRLANAFYANAMKGAFSGVPAIICGAGPSLTGAIPLLKQLEGRALVIAGGSAIPALTSGNYKPHLGMAIDPNIEEVHRFRDSTSFDSPLLISTRVHPDIFNTCNSPVGYLRAGVGGLCELWLEEALGLTDPLIGKHLFVESMSVTTIAVAFAQHIGCNPILLSGVDLAYTGGERYAAGISAEKSPLQEDQLLRRKGKQGRTLDTAVRWVMEAKSLAHYAKKHPEIRWINTTSGGLRIEGMEEMSLETAAALHLTRQWDLHERVAHQMALHPMPCVPANLFCELQESLERVVQHLEVLVGARAGSAALAECELEGELAVAILFYDMGKVPWERHLEIARRYAERLKLA